MLLSILFLHHHLLSRINSFTISVHHNKLASDVGMHFSFFLLLVCFSLLLFTAFAVALAAPDDDEGQLDEKLKQVLNDGAVKVGDPSEAALAL